MIYEHTSSKHQKGCRLQPLLQYFLVSGCLLLYWQFALLLSSSLLAKHQQASSLVAATACRYHSVNWQRLCPLSNQQLVTHCVRSWGEGGKLQGTYVTSLFLPAALCHSPMTAGGHFLVPIPKRRHHCPRQQHTPLSAVVQAGPFSIKHSIFEKGYHHGALKYSRKFPGHNPKGFLTHGLCDLQLTLLTTQKRWNLER